MVYAGGYLLFVRIAARADNPLQDRRIKLVKNLFFNGRIVLVYDAGFTVGSG